MTGFAQKAERLLQLHQSGGLLLPNAWDVGSARIFEAEGFPAIATTSAGVAFAAGRPDGGLSGAAMLDAVAAIVDAVSCPVSADLEAGYGASPADVGATIRRAVDIGCVGANIEDLDPATGSLFPVDVAVARLAAARDAAPAGTFVLNARTDVYLVGTDGGFDEAVARAAAYVEAGADCVFVPGVDDPGTIGALVDAIDAPLNVVAGLTGRVLGAEELRALGVARITVGGSLARAALGFVARAAVDLRAGRFDHAAAAIPHADLQRRFGS